MNDQLISQIINKSDFLNNSQKIKLKQVLVDVLNNKQTKNYTDSELIDLFISTKQIEGRSQRTLDYYQEILSRSFNQIDKLIPEIETFDVRNFLAEYQTNGNVTATTLDNVRRVLSSFFNWLEDEEYILKSPMKRIHKIKSRKKVKKVITDEELVVLRDNIKNIRDLAMIDFLFSTGIRVGELVRLNREDIDFSKNECVVYGKGDKERIVYFSAQAKIHLKNYLDSRTDNNPALFVTLRKPFRRIQINSIEKRIRELGRSVGIDHLHPHKFRRSVATKAIDKGMPIEQVKELLGHEKIDTTMEYAMVKQQNVKFSHSKYID